MLLTRSKACLIWTPGSGAVLRLVDAGGKCDRTVSCHSTQPPLPRVLALGERQPSFSSGCRPGFLTLRQWDVGQQGQGWTRCSRGCGAAQGVPARGQLEHGTWARWHVLGSGHAASHHALPEQRDKTGTQQNPKSLNSYIYQAFRIQ